MTRLLGFLIAFFVTGWGLRWYFSRADAPEEREGQLQSTPTVAVASTPAITLPGDATTTLSNGADSLRQSLASEEFVLNEAYDSATVEPEADDSEDEGDEVELADVPVIDIIIGFCARCRDKREVGNAIYTRTKKGKLAIRGTCTVCDAGMFVFVPEDSINA